MDDAQVKEMVRDRYGSIAAEHANAARPPPVAGRPRTRRSPPRRGASATRKKNLRRCRRAPISASAAAIRRRSRRMRPGEVVVDLGSGAGFDCLLAAQQVGPRAGSSAST